MPQLVTQIILVDQDHGFANQEENKVQAVVEYVNGLTLRYFYLDELPSNAVRAYYADIYMGEVLNGDIDQFVATPGQGVGFLLVNSEGANVCNGLRRWQPEGGHDANVSPGNRESAGPWADPVSDRQELP